MDQLKAWAVRGRLATALRGAREALAALEVSGKELDDAMAEAAQLNSDTKFTSGQESQDAAV